MKKTMGAPGADFLSGKRVNELMTTMEKAMIADDGKPGKSLKETSTEELKATLAKLKPTDPGAEARIGAIKGELKSRGDGGEMEKADPTPEKARQILHDGTVRGKPITEQQRKFFGAIGGHLPAPGGKAKKSMSYEEFNDFLEKARMATGVGGKTKSGYTVKMVGGKKTYVKERKSDQNRVPHEYGTMHEHTKDIGGGKQTVIRAIRQQNKGDSYHVRVEGEGGKLAGRGATHDVYLSDHGGDHEAALAEAKKKHAELHSHFSGKEAKAQEAAGKKAAREKKKAAAGGSKRTTASLDKKPVGTKMSVDFGGETYGAEKMKSGQWQVWAESGAMGREQVSSDKLASLVDQAKKADKAKKSMSYENLDDYLEKAGRGGTGVGGKTKGGYTVKMVGGKKRYVKEKEGKKKPPSGEGVKVLPGMEGKTVKPAGMAGPGVTVQPGMEGKTVKPAGEKMGAKQAASLVQNARKYTVDTGKGHTFSDDPAQSKKTLDALPSGTVVTRYDDTGYGDMSMVKVGEKWVSEYEDSAQDDWDVDPDEGPDMKHQFTSAEMGKMVSGGWSDATIWMPKSGMKKSMESVMSLDGFEGLDDWLQKSGGLPTHQQGMGHKKSSAVEGGSADGGDMADVGRTSGSCDSAPGPEQDAQGQIKGVSPGGKAKLSDDDAEEGKQMTDHKKPIESVKKSAFPADQRDTVAQEHAAVVSRLRKSDDVYIGPDRHPLSHYATHASGDLEASELVKSESFYEGNSPQVAPSRPIIEQGVLCKSVNATGCEMTYSAALTSCPGCGAGTVGHRHVPGGPIVGAEMTILEKSMGPGSLLRRPRQEPDIKIG